MEILVVNPNTTAGMTAKIAAAAAAVAAPGTRVTAVNPETGPASIEGWVDGALAVPALLREIARGEARGVAGHVIACFDDTGLDAARSLAAVPVVGIGEAAFHVASLLAGRFAVVTTLGRSIPVIEANLQRYGLASRCARVRAAEIPVLELERPGSEAEARISAEIAAALEGDRAEAIVLGCAGMADLATRLSARHGVPVVDGVAAAVTLVEALARLGLRTAKTGGYASPRPKPYAGGMTGFGTR
ncbi:aspartate/glutamate racemase family protein [Inquilinus limosus]|uniref:Hydantoin racemase n=1 Tax=Inquilinus limosus TaxID=171674 RepID=A0A211ZUE8_9PROT|nr:aspartate/glutamate racemase family protein [Inquilinus limosus]OWJ68873.1 Asp/Glu/hydantoin racemase [Inquilinus limosus]